MSTLHDNHLVGYTVDGNARRIVLRTERREPNRPVDLVNVIFEGVEAYWFRYDCLANIVLDLMERPLDEAIESHWSELDAGHRASGWPRFWQRDEEKTRERIARLTEQGAKWFELTSSYGMEGWVLCHSLEILNVEDPNGRSEESWAVRRGGERSRAPLRALLVAMTKQASWTRRFELPFAPFVGLGIRLDVYEMVNVESVIVGDTTSEVTCIVGPEPGRSFDDAWLTRHGFEIAPYP